MFDFDDDFEAAEWEYASDAEQEAVERQAEKFGPKREASHPHPRKECLTRKVYDSRRIRNRGHGAKRPDYKNHRRNAQREAQPMKSRSDHY